MDPAKVAFLFGTVPDGFDPDDPEDRAELLRGPDDHLPPAVQAVREILATQIADETPPEAWATAQRLLAAGLEPATVMSQMAMAVAHTAQAAVADAVDGASPPFDSDGYRALLRGLPLPGVAEIEPAMVAITRARPEIVIDDLIDRVVEELGGVPDGLVETLVDRVFDQLVDEDGPLALMAGDKVVHVGDLTEGIVLTHRLTAAEHASDALLLSFDLAGFARCDVTHLASGTDLEWDWIDDDDLAWVGPDGWLAEFGIGSLLAVRVDPDGLVTIEELTDSDSDGDVVTLLRSVYDREIEEAATPITGEELVIGMLVADRRIFDRPLAPLDELCEAAGLERRGDCVAHDQSVWRLREEIRRASRVYEEFDDQDDRDAVMRVLALADEAEPAVEHLRRALFDLCDPSLADGVLDRLFDDDAPDGPVVAERFVTALVAAATTARQIAVARWMAAVVAERAGEPLVADAHIQIAVEAGESWVPLVDRAGWYASDKGDAATAMRLWRLLDHPSPNDVETVGPFEHSSTPKIGRNDPCWCGSGRKYKACHLGQIRSVPLPDRVGWLCRKAVAYIEHQRADAGAMVVSLAMARAGHGDTKAMVAALEDPIVMDAALTEGGWFARFLGDRGPLLPEDEALLAETWLLVARTVYEVISIEAGVGVTVRVILRTGDQLLVRERTFSREAVLGQLICTRAVPDGETHQFIGALFPVAPGTEGALLDLCDERDPVALCEWVAALYRPPTISTREGEPMVHCTAEVQVVDPVLAAAVLDDNYDRDGDLWIEVHPISEDDDIIRASLTLEGNRIVIETQSEPRIERVLALLADELPGSEVLKDVREPLSVGDVSRPPAAARLRAGTGGPGDSADMVAALAEIQDQFERRWVAESVPALAGLTPQEATDDPTRRGELERLIASFPTADQLPAGAVGLRPDRLRSLLGLPLAGGEG